METQKLKTLAEQGFVPGPFENEADFLRRVDYCLQLEKELGFEAVPPQLFEPPFSLTHSLFGIKPSWVPLSFSNYQLPLWVGGCAWIFQNTHDSPTGAFIQLRKKLQTSPSFCLYSRDELIAHEISHIGRMMFEEPKYEEVFAYKTSPSSFRKFLGPLFSEGGQMRSFMILVVFVLLADLCALWWGGWESYVALLPLKLIPGSWFGWMLYKLSLKQLRIKRLEKRFPLKFLYGLTDKEIDAFDKMTKAQVEEYARLQQCLRWKYLLFNIGNFD